MGKVVRSHKPVDSKTLEIALHFIDHTKGKIHCAVNIHNENFIMTDTTLLLHGFQNSERLYLKKVLSFPLVITL